MFLARSCWSTLGTAAVIVLLLLSLRSSADAVAGCTHSMPVIWLMMPAPWRSPFCVLLGGPSTPR
jgi:hypothetical protein